MALIGARRTSILERQLWLPTNIGAIAWWDGRPGGGQVIGASLNDDAWVDRAANIYVPYTGSNRPAPQAQSVYFNGSTYFLFTAPSTFPVGSAPITIGVATYLAAAGTHLKGIFGYGGANTSGDTRTLSMDTNGKYCFGVINTSVSSAVTIGNATHLGVVSMSGTAVTFNVDGATTTETATLATTPATTLTTNQAFLGYGSQFVTSPSQPQGLQGSIFQIVVIPRLLTTGERQKLEGFMAWAAGFPNVLPAAHPYKSRPPFTSDP